MKLLESLSVRIRERLIHKLVKEGYGCNFPLPGPLAEGVGSQDEWALFPAGDGTLEFVLGDDLHPIDHGTHLPLLTGKADIVLCAERNIAQFDHCGYSARIAA